AGSPEFWMLPALESYVIYQANNPRSERDLDAIRTATQLEGIVSRGLPKDLTKWEREEIGRESRLFARAEQSLFLSDTRPPSADDPIMLGVLSTFLLLLGVAFLGVGVVTRIRNLRARKQSRPQLLETPDSASADPSVGTPGVADSEDEITG